MNIKPHKLILTSGVATATQIAVSSVLDDLVDQVTFRVRLISAEDCELLQTSVALSGADYKTWDGSSAGAHKICAEALGLTLI